MTIMAMTKRITTIRNPIKKFVMKTDRIASVKYPIIRQPVTVPKDIAKKSTIKVLVLNLRIFFSTTW